MSRTSGVNVIKHFFFVLSPFSQPNALKCHWYAFPEALLLVVCDLSLNEL